MNRGGNNITLTTKFTRKREGQRQEARTREKFLQ